MAVIITNMYKPGCCSGCKLCDKGNLTDYGQFGKCLLTNNRVNLLTWNIDKDCPLKSTDEMITEIEDTYIDNCNYDYQTAVDIIHKYCDKEAEHEANKTR